MTSKISEYGEEFLKLALRIDKHNKGYVDFYIGPEYLRQIVDNESSTSPNKLLNDANTLIKQLGNKGYDKDRERYLIKTLTAMKTMVEVLKGYDIPFSELIYRLHDIKIKPINDSELYQLKQDFDKAYEGSGTLEARMEELRIRRTIPGKYVYKFLIRALNIVKNKTEEIFTDLLAQEEQITIKLIKQNNNEILWSYYVSYLGNYCSRIEVNPNYNMYWTSLLPTSAHEGYPGHHTEFILKELLYQKLDQFEHSILILNSPKLIISEGIAELAINVLFNYREQAEIGLNEFCPNRLQEDSLEKLTYQNSVRRKVSYFIFNLGYYAHVEKWREDKLFRYAKSFEIFSEKNIKNRIKALDDPVLSIMTFPYYIGSKLIIDKYGEFPQAQEFEDLLRNPILPSDLV
ncbi:MAG: hypothetical protein ACW98D_06045 [Promethearchaeota archaeon]|jgi:hypothetical protein